MSRFIVLFTLLIFVCGCGSGDKPAADATPPATSTEPETLIVDASSTGPLDASSKIFTRIGVAIGRAKSGDTIKIRPGNYRETLEIEKALTLIGDGPADKIVIVGKSMATIAIGADVTLSNLTLRHTTVDKVSLDVVRGKVIVDNCDISNEVSSGVRTLPNSEMEMRKCKIHDCKLNGLYLKGKVLMEENEITKCVGQAVCFESADKFVLRKNTIHDNTNTGCYFMLHCTGLIEANDVYANGLEGIGIDKASVVTLTKNNVYRNEDNGILVTAKSQATIDGGEIYKNAADGVQAYTEAKMEVRRVKISENGHQGVHFAGNSTGLVEDCEVARTLNAGISLVEKSTATVKHCKVYGGNSNGVNATSGATLTLEESDVHDNELPGVAIYETGRGTLRKNKIHNHDANPGIVVFDNANAVIEENEVYDNTLDGLRVRRGGNATVRKNIFKHNADYGIEVSQKGEGIFEDNDIRENLYGAWGIAPDNGGSVQRARNKCDETPLSKAKVGDWGDYKYVISSPTINGETALRFTVMQRTEDAVFLEMTRIIGEKTEKKSESFDLSRKNSILNNIVDDPNASVEELDKGVESVQAAGRSFDTTWQRYAFSSQRKGVTVEGTVKVWRSPEVAVDGTVRTEMVFTNGMKMTSLLTAFGDARKPRSAAAATVSESKSAPAISQQPKSSPPAATAPKTSASAKPAAPETKSAPTGVTIYVLKDGRRIRSVKSMDAGDALSIKNELGKFEAIQKTDIQETIQE